MCGSPVIASSFESLRFVSQEGIGVQVSHPSEIPAAIQELTRNERVYRERCLSFATHEGIREQQSWEDLVRALSNKIDLRKGLPQQEPTDIKGVRLGGKKRALGRPPDHPLVCMDETSRPTYAWMSSQVNA